MATIILGGRSFSPVEVNDRERAGLARPAAQSGSECVSLSVGLGRAKGIDGHASLEDRSQGAVVVERTIEALGVENLRHETNVGHGDGVAIAEATSDARTSHVSLQTSSAIQWRYHALVAASSAPNCVWMCLSTRTLLRG